MDEEKFLKKITFLKALAHPVRLEIVFKIAEKERTVSELADILGKNPNFVSQYLCVLKDEGIIEYKTADDHILYGIKDKNILSLLKILDDLLSEQS